RGRRLRRARPPAGAAYTQRGRSRPRRKPMGARGLRRGRRRPLPPLLPHRAAEVRCGGHGLGAEEILRDGLSVVGRRMRLANKVALITGGGSGIGKASSLLFARGGAAVDVVVLRERRV